MSRLGNQSPTQSVILPYSETLGEEAISIYEKSKRKAQEWQINLIKHMLATNDEGLWTHTKFGYSIPRRNGKNEVVVIREVFGLIKGEHILHTAHRTSTSHSAFERLENILQEAGYVKDKDFTSLKAKGQERIEFTDSKGGRIDFRTRTTTGGLGEGFDTVIIDEAQEYTKDQESSLKYVVSSSQNPQTIYCGTPPTLVSSGTVFNELRNKVLYGQSRNTAWAEWGVENESDPEDRELWYLTNPSLGTILNERKIEDEIGDEDKLDFNIQRLGLWVKYNQKSDISKKDWEALKVNGIPEIVGKLHVGIKYGKDGINVSMSIAAKTKQNTIFIEVIDCQSMRNGNQWLIDFLKKAEVENIVIDGAGNQDILKKELKENGIKKVILPTVKEYILATSKFENAIYQKVICHNDQPSLTEVATNCEKRPIGTQGGFGYKSQYSDKDITLLESAIIAFWSCAEIKEKKKQKIYY